ncbi:MAG: PqqD family protein [Bacteroidales bacterium]|nr:PqqD family protein [Bacteroidales bacterium]
MRIKQGFKMRSVGRDHIVIPEGKQLINFNKMAALNSSAAYLWEKVVDKDFTVEDLTALLVEKYEIDEQRAKEDAEKLVASLQEAGIIE